jgi:hypothetical protein
VVSLAVPATLHEMYGQELAELLDTVPASQVVPDRSLRTFAYRSGLALANVYFKELGVFSGEGTASSALVNALHRPHLHAVVVRSQEHFSRFGGMYRPMCTVIKSETDADIPVMSGSGRGGR